MTSDLRQVVRDNLREYLRRTDPNDESFRLLATTHHALPILPDWTGFVGLREDGGLLWVPEDAAPSEPDEWVTFLALVRAGELFPALAFLRPEPTHEWIECWSCGGTGIVMIDGLAAPHGVRCQCAGLGRFPPNVARFLQRRDESSLTSR